MTVQNLWPLAFLIFIPVIILLYILKKKVKDETFSSTLLWKEIYKNLEAETPFEKLRHNILMYLQILLLLLLMFALMAPIIKKGGKIQEHTVFVIDNSASMQYMFHNQETRLEHSIKEAKREVDALSENTMVTLVTSSDDAKVIYQGRDKSTLKKRLSEIEPTLESGTFDVAASMINSIISGMENGQVIGYTDSDFDSKAWIKNNKKISLIIENVYSEGENCSIDYVNYTTEQDGTEILCKVTNHGKKEITQDVSLYLNSDLAQVQTITIRPNEDVIVYFDKQNIVTDGSVILRTELSNQDALPEDNIQSIVLTENISKRVLIISKGNVFLEKAIALNENAEVYKADNVNVLNQSEDLYDLYVFDGMYLPEDFEFSKFPENAGFLFLNYDKDFCQQKYVEKQSTVSDSILYFIDSPITKYMEQHYIGTTKAYTYQLPEWGIPFLKTEDGNYIGYYGRVGTHNVGVVGFDLHSTDFALQTEFPIFMSQFIDLMLGNNIDVKEIINFPVEKESVVTASDEVKIKAVQGKKKTGGRAIRNLILIFVLLLLGVEWIIYVKQANSSKKKQFFVVRCLVLLAIILAMVGLSVPKKQEKCETIFLVDVSDSMSGNKKQVENYIQDMIQDMPKKNLSAVIAFGKDTSVDQFLSDKKDFNRLSATPVTVATNIEKAIQAANSMFDDGVSKRLVLISDGSENEGNMSITANILKENDIEFLVIPVKDSIAGNHEVYINEVLTPNVIHAGDHYNVMVSVTSNIETDAILYLYAGRKLKGQQEISLTKGENQFVFEDTGIEGDIAEYKAVIEAEEDTISVNNTYVTFAEIEAKPRILLIEGKVDEAAEFEKILKVANIEYDKVSPKGVPNKVADLNQYKAVISLDVHYDDLRSGFDKALESYVKDHAGGYICIGGENSYALGGYRNTKLEEVLPVNMALQGEKEIPKMAMIMVMDQSGSMMFPSEDNSSVTGLDLAKQAAIAGVSELRKTDDVGVLAFSDSYNWVIPIKNATDFETIKEQIRTIGSGGGTSIYPALEEAYNKVLNSDAQIKHIVLLTDGQDTYQDYDTLLNKIRESGVTVSTVAAGSDSDQNKLSYIAEQCGGRYYYTDINNAIPRIFAQEVYLSTSNYLMNDEFYPIITTRHEILNGLTDEGLPALLGYIAASPKQTAEVLLESEKGDPILTTWQCGLGRTIAWNTDGNNEWTGNYALWDNYPLLWANMIHYVISDTELGEDQLDIVKEGNQAVLTYETKEYDKNTRVKAVITDQEGKTSEIPLNPMKPGVFEGRLDVEDVGIYSINIRKMSGKDVLKNYNTAYANQYSTEYQFVNLKTEFSTFVKQAGGKEISYEDNIWTKNEAVVKAKVSLTIPLLILAILLFIFDIIVRRLSIDLFGYLKKIGNVFYVGIENIKKIFFKKKKVKQVERKNHDSNQSEKELVDSVIEVENPIVNHKEKIDKQKISKEKTSKKDKKKDKNQNENEKLDMNQLLKKKRDRE